MTSLQRVPRNEQIEKWNAEDKHKILEEIRGRGISIMCNNSHVGLCQNEGIGPMSNKQINYIMEPEFRNHRVANFGHTIWQLIESIS